MDWTAPDSISSFCGVWPSQIPNDSLSQVATSCASPAAPGSQRVSCSTGTTNNLQLWGGSQRYTWALNLLLAFTSNNWALQIDLTLWFHWDHRSSPGMISKGAIFLGQTLRSINLITALFTFKQSIFGAFCWFFIQDTFHLPMIQLLLTTSFWNCPYHIESYFSNPLNIENLLLK